MRANARDFKNVIFSHLQHIQATTVLIDPTCNTWNNYVIKHSGTRLLIAHATNDRVKSYYLELQCR